MSAQMAVCYVKTLGHVMAAFTRASEPDQIEATPDAFVGEGLHLRGISGPPDQDFTIPVAQIGLLRTDLNPAVLRAPRQWFADLTATPPTMVESSQTLTASNPTPSSIVLSATSPIAFAPGTTVTTLIEGPSLSNPLPVSLSASATSSATINIPLPALSPGNYFALVLVPLYPIVAVPFTVP
jgi:hypothetical protein